MSEDIDSIHQVIARAGWFRDAVVAPIGGTGNNAVFRVEADGKSFVLKRYFQHPGDPRDRFATERAFCKFLWDSGVRWTPEPLAWDEAERLGLFEFCVGTRPQRATPELIAAALSFLCEANDHRATEAARVLPLASEACFSVCEHLERVAHRVARLQGIVATDGIEKDAESFVRERLVPTWNAVRHSAGSTLDPGLRASAIDVSERCLSPSDFGFHNALAAPDGQVRFVDFEYAGWDDPAKLVCDFFCQPAVPVKIDMLDDFWAGLGEFATSKVRERVSTLLPVYRIKWCCIMLNEFLPADRSRRAFSDPQHDPVARKRAQLEKAKQGLNAIER